jgi:molecular chaperone GrpE
VASQARKVRESRQGTLKKELKHKDPSVHDEPATEPETEATSDPSIDYSEQIAILRNALESTAIERDQLRDQMLRTMAEFQNFKKRTEAERQAHRQLANERLVLDLLPVLDNFERTVIALQSGSSIESVVGGIQAVERQLRSVMEMHSVARIDALGKRFDPEFHEAVSTDESEEHDEDTVLIELEPGYTMADKVIRPARVKVSKKP